jgi:uncharacterized protein YprB with RNaseH-like and TPR domain
LSSLSERLRAVVRGNAPSNGAPPAPPRQASDIAALGGQWRGEGASRCLVVEERREASAAFGHDTVGALADRLAAAADQAALVTGVAVRPPFAFFDLETTGLSGGAGTHAFLVGCGWFEADGAFVTRQFMLTRLADERALLVALADELARAGAIVSFNGKSFDAPVLETRYLFHRLPWPCEQLPHLDVLHPSRRFWRPSASQHARGRGAGAPDDLSSCSLGTLEREILGVRRIGDVSGFEIPARYFQFIRSGDAGPLVPVLEHNRLDLLSLAGLTARLLDLVRQGPDAARDARETLALGRIYARAGLDSRARQAFERAAARVSSGMLRVEALRALALGWRRARRHDEAAACWRALLEVASCPPHIACEAMEALAVHHEHRVRDLPAARAFAMRSLGTRKQATAALQHRLSRIERKMGQGSRLSF